MILLRPKPSLRVLAAALLVAAVAVGAQEPAAETPPPPREPAPETNPSPNPSPKSESESESAPVDTRLAKLSPLGRAPDWAALIAAFKETMTREEFEAAWRDFYHDGSPYPMPWKIEDDALVIMTGNPADPAVTIPFRTAASAETPRPVRFWRRAGELPPLQGRPPLSDLHIAIDPGHIGGDFARMEERHLSMKPGEAIQEGDLTLLTAQVLMTRLQNLGAYVTLVREKPEPVTHQRPADLTSAATTVLRDAGIANPATQYDGLTGDAKVVTVQWQSEKLFYRVSEIHARAERVNGQIKPDLVLCLHFNAEAWGDPQAPQFVQANHFHALINGCYAPVELEQQDVRHEMMQRLLGRIHEEELPLTESVADGMALITGLPAYVYTTPNARRAGMNSYVYARNLLANRLYQCPVVYLEPYVMNHEPTYRRLLLGHYAGRTLLNGTLQTSAIEDYVKGVVKGLVSYYQGKRRSA